MWYSINKFTVTVRRAVTYKYILEFATLIFLEKETVITGYYLKITKTSIC